MPLNEDGSAMGVGAALIIFSSPVQFLNALMPIYERDMGNEFLQVVYSQKKFLAQ